MRTKLGTWAAAGALGLAGITGVVATGAALAPASASTAATSQDAQDGVGSFLAERLQAIRDALAGLVDDGTITQEQADRVAETLGESMPRGGHHHHGPGLGMALDAAAEALGMSTGDLRTALRDGQSLAEVAQQQGVETADLVDALVVAAQERLDEAVAEGRISAERADEISGTLQERITEHLDDAGGLRGGGRGHHGPGGPDA